MTGTAGQTMRAVVVLALAVAATAGCSRNGTPDLLNFPASDDGPDEFTVLPTKPLQAPESYATLPAPTPGGTNLTDPTPEADAIAALGGRPSVLTRASADGALVRYAGRYGVAPAIRSELAVADLEYRRQNDGRLLERLFDVNVYYRAYRPLSLDQYRELERFRRAGIRTPAAPPDPALEQ